MRIRYDARAEQECEIRVLCPGCKKVWKPNVNGDIIECPNCHTMRGYGFRCMKCNRAYLPKRFEPRICPDCHPELFIEDDTTFVNSKGVTPMSAPKPALAPKPMSAAPKTLAQRIHESEVTYLRDRPEGADFTRELYDEWYSKLDPDDHETLRDLGQDPYDPWR